MAPPAAAEVVGGKDGAGWLSSTQGARGPALSCAHLAAMMGLGHKQHAAHEVCGRHALGAFALSGGPKGAGVLVLDPPSGPTCSGPHLRDMALTLPVHLQVLTHCAFPAKGIPGCTTSCRSHWPQQGL